MRMAHALAIILAVLSAAAGAGADAALLNATWRRASPHHPHRIVADEDMESVGAWKRAYWRDTQAALRAAGPKGEAECCPSVVEMVAPRGGRNPSGLYVELYEDGENRQRLHEISCAAGVVGQPCRFLDARLYNQSRCVQSYSYSYALVRSPAATEPPRHRREDQPFSVLGAGGWALDYVRVRSGCKCQLTPPRRKRRYEKHHPRKRKGRFPDDEDT